MKNITLAIDDETLEAGREYARQHNTSLNGLVRDLLIRTVRRDRGNATEELLELMQKHTGDSRGKHWSREDLYD